MRNPEAKPQEIAEHVCRTIPGASTTAASVSSVLSRMKSGTGTIGQAALAGKSGLASPFQAAVDGFEDETDEEALARITVRYAAYKRHCRKVVLMSGTSALICSGPPGLGKSYEVRRAIEESGRINFVEIEDRLLFGEDPEVYCRGNELKGVYDMISGSITA